MPLKLRTLGNDLLNRFTEKIYNNFKGSLPKLIKSELLKKKLIPSLLKVPNIKQFISEGNKIKDQICLSMNYTCKCFFSSIMEQFEVSLLEEKKAFSYLSFKEREIGYIINHEGDGSVSIIKVRSSDKNKNQEKLSESPFEVVDIIFLASTNEIQICVKNKRNKIIENIHIKLKHVKEFFEKELINECIEQWDSQEAILFFSSIIPKINEFLFLTIENHNKEKLLVQKIDSNII